MIKLAALLNSTRLSQILLLVLTEFTQIKKNNPDISICLFVEQQEFSPVKIEFPIFHVSDCYFFDGIVIANSIGDANKLRFFPGPTQKYYYLHNLEHIYVQGKKYHELSSIYNDKNLKLIAPSKHYYNIFSKYWKKPDSIIENFHISELLNV